MHLSRICILKTSNTWILLHEEEEPTKHCDLSLDEKFASSVPCFICSKPIAKVTSCFEDSLFNFELCDNKSGRHRFHRKCLKQHIKASTSDDVLNFAKHNVKCPRCKCTMTFSDVKLIFGLKKYKQLKLKRFFSKHKPHS